MILFAICDLFFHSSVKILMKVQKIKRQNFKSTVNKICWARGHIQIISKSLRQNYGKVYRKPTEVLPFYPPTQPLDVNTLNYSFFKFLPTKGRETNLAYTLYKRERK